MVRGQSTGQKMINLKKEKRTKKERKLRMGGDSELLTGSTLPLYYKKLNRTSINVYTQDIFNCA
jgi:hypothetical protein